MLFQSCILKHVIGSRTDRSRKIQSSLTKSNVNVLYSLGYDETHCGNGKHARGTKGTIEGYGYELESLIVIPWALAHSSHNRIFLLSLPLGMDPDTMLISMRMMKDNPQMMATAQKLMSNMTPEEMLQQSKAAQEKMSSMSREELEQAAEVRFTFVQKK